MPHDREGEAADRELMRTTLAWRVGVLEGTVERHERELRDMPDKWRAEHEAYSEHGARNVMILLALLNVAGVILNIVLAHGS